MTLLDKIFSFQGRLRRRDYWLISLAIGIPMFIVTDLLRLALFGPEMSMFVSGFNGLTAAGLDSRSLWLTQAVSLAVFWPSLAMSAKRAHDRNTGARPILAMLVIIQIIEFAQLIFGRNSPFTGGLIGTLVVGVMGLYLFVVIGCLDGTPGPNRHGPSPKGVGGDGDLASTFE